MAGKKRWLVYVGALLLGVLGNWWWGGGSKSEGQKTIKTSPTVAMPTKTPELISGKRPQLVVISFDGSRSLTMWRKTLDFAKEEKGKGVVIKYTYFISGVYFLPVEKRLEYQAPRQKPGESLIGFADNEEDVQLRIKLVQEAATDGHEIASHLNGHFPGYTWNQAEWEKELETFKRLTSRIGNLDIVGFRAPNLAVNENLWPALAKYGYTYDAGSVGKADEWPKNIGGVWRIGLPAIRVRGTDKYSLAMDYNFYVTQTQAKETLKRGTAEWITTKNQVVNSLKDYFAANYGGSRAPVVFSSHFSEWNDGVYWEATKEFAGEICQKAEVKCVSYKEVVKFMEEKKSETKF